MYLHLLLHLCNDSKLEWLQTFEPCKNIFTSDMLDCKTVHDMGLWIYCHTYNSRSSWSSQAHSSELTRFPGLIIEKDEYTHSVMGVGYVLAIYSVVRAAVGLYTHSDFLNHVLFLPQYGGYNNTIADCRIIGTPVLSHLLVLQPYGLPTWSSPYSPSLM